MVLTQRHAPLHTLHLALSRMQPQRIVGMSSAIALNFGVLMLLMIPATAPLAVQEEKFDTTIFTIPAAKPKPPVEVPVEHPKPKPATTTPQHTIAAPQKPQAQTNSAVATDPVPTDSKPIDIPTPPTGGTVDPPYTGGGGGEIGVSTHLEYASAPPPMYPRDALLGNLEGTVLLKVLVDVDGKPLSVEIARSSGHRVLDEAARRQVLRKWTFQPAIQNGLAIQVYGMVPVNFSLSLQ